MNEILGGAPFSVRVLTMLGVVVEWIRLLVWPAQLSADYSFPRTHVATTPALHDSGRYRDCRMRHTGVVDAPFEACDHLRDSLDCSHDGNSQQSRNGHRICARGAHSLSCKRRRCTHRVSCIGRGVQQDGYRSAYAACRTSNCRRVARSVRDNSELHAKSSVARQRHALSPDCRGRAIQLARSLDAGEHFASTNRQREAVDEMLLAVALGRKDDVLLLDAAADRLQMNGMCGRAMPLYRRAIALTPKNEQLRANTSLCLMTLGKIAEARALALSGIEMRRASPTLIRSVALADSLTRVAHDRSLKMAR